MVEEPTDLDFHVFRGWSPLAYDCFLRLMCKSNFHVTRVTDETITNLQLH